GGALEDRERRLGSIPRPFGFVAVDGRRAPRQRGEVEPDHRETVRLRAVSENRDREFRAREVRLDQYRLRVALDQKPDALPQRRRTVAQVVAEHTLAGSLRHGLHEHGKRQRQPVYLVRRGEARERSGGDAAEGEGLPGEPRVRRKRGG